MTPARRGAAPAAGPPVPAAPLAWRDPWTWLAALAVVPLWLRSWGAPLGEPVAEDFDFLHRALLERSRTLLDGGGSLAFWRPLAHQIYYLALGRLILSHPMAVAAIHAGLLALGAVLVYRAFRTVWNGPLACAAAVFPLLSESTRTLIAWPTQFVDLGLFLFSALALHEASRRRLPTALASLVAALLCKELAVITALMLPLAPFPALRGRRVRWAAGFAALTIAWAIAYLGVRRMAHLELPHHLEHDAAVQATPAAVRFLWALLHSARAVMSLPAARGRRDDLAFLGGLALMAAAAWMLARRGTSGRRSPSVRWMVWGFSWFVLSAAALATLFPFWQPNRSQFGSIGLGIGATALFESVHPALAGGLVVLRLALLATSPGPPRRIERDAPGTGAFMDFPHLVRLQRLAVDTRLALRRRYPTLPAGTHVGWHTLPLLASYAFGGSRALQVWYGDTTLSWVSFSDVFARRDTSVLTFTEFQTQPPQIVLVDSAAMQAYLGALDAVRDQRFVDGLGKLARADAAQEDPHARVFLGSVAGTRAQALLGLGRLEQAGHEARRSAAMWDGSFDAHLVLGHLASLRRDWGEVDAQADSALAILPDQAAARRLVEAMHAR